MEHKPCCDRRTWFQREKCLSLKLSKRLWVSRWPTPAPAPQLSPTGLRIPSWGPDLSGDTAGTKIHHQMLKYGTEAYSRWIIKQSPNLRLWGGGLCSYRLCARNWLPPRPLTPALPTRRFLGSISTQADRSNRSSCTAALLFLKTALETRLVKGTVPELSGHLYFAPLDVPPPLIIYSR